MRIKYLIFLKNNKNLTSYFYIINSKLFIHVKLILFKKCLPQVKKVNDIYIYIYIL